MRKILSLIVACIIAYSFAGCNQSANNATGLRDTTWGMTRKEVIKSEKAEFLGTDENYVRFYDRDNGQPIVFYGSLFKTKVDLWYYFNSDDRLYKIQYRLISAADLEIYDSIKEMMTALYGAPYAENIKDEDDESVTRTSWKYKKSDITLEINYDAEDDSSVIYAVFLPNT
jgi:hypothetical protein